MIKVCSYCRKVLGYKCATCSAFLIQVREKANRGYCYKCRKHVNLDDGGTTHGACDPCLENELAAIRQGQKKGGEPTKRLERQQVKGAAVQPSTQTSETSKLDSSAKPQKAAAPQSLAPGPRRADALPSTRVRSRARDGQSDADRSPAEMPTGAIPSSVAGGQRVDDQPLAEYCGERIATVRGASDKAKAATDSPSDSPPTGYTRQEWAQLEAAHMNHLSRGGWNG